ncbi:MAG: EF-P beta-lysylation protein EpmB [Acinetobacter sp.]|nr:EF-P beta-lysylation protein EpmB [Acinetobacter sp.]
MINDLSKNWQMQFSDLITNPAELLAELALSHENLQSGAVLASQQFKLRVPRAFVAKMQKGNAQDPLLLQVLPHHLELSEQDGFVADPLAERDANHLRGVIHKYQSRFLLTLTGACAVHCRYCFRRHFPYQDNLPKQQDWLEIANYLQQHPEINEIILSGGDPLSLNNRQFFMWLERLESVPQIKTLRIHSRVPIVIPERLDDELIERLNASRLAIILVVHCNHAQEIDEHTGQYLAKVARSKVHVFNQTVLLKGVNDSVETLEQLSYRLFEFGVLPYYLHALDRVQGASHFEVEEARMMALYQGLLSRVSGYLVPKLVREIAGEPNKTPLLSEMAQAWA